jgi:predicted ArsR family transcriptional regulator
MTPVLLMLCAFLLWIAASAMRGERQAIERLILLHLKEREASAQEIQDAHGLGRVAVFNALHDLEGEGRLNSRPIDVKGETRPRIVYRLAGAVPDTWKLSPRGSR